MTEASTGVCDVVCISLFFKAALLYPTAESERNKRGELSLGKLRVSGAYDFLECARTCIR